MRSGRQIWKAHDGIRTRDLFLTKEVLYRLSYMGARRAQPEQFQTIQFPTARNLTPNGLPGAGNGTRTRDPELGRLALYQLSYSRSPTSILLSYIKILLVERGGFEPPKA